MRRHVLAMGEMSAEVLYHRQLIHARRPTDWSLRLPIGFMCESVVVRHDKALLN